MSSAIMQKWIISDTQQYSENTPEYGFGDYPEQINFIITVVEADTRRKAQNAAKKQFPNLRFGGQFGPRIFSSDTDMAYLYTKKADSRLSPRKIELHNSALIKLGLSSSC